MAVTTLNDANFNESLAQHDKVVVKYHAAWCGSCKLFAPKYKRVSNEEEYSDVFFAEVDAEENEAARKLAGVDNLPFLATFKNGELVDGTPTSKEEKLKEMLDQLKQ